MEIPKSKNQGQPQYEGGQAAVLRDQKRINELKTRNDLKNPEIAFEVYEHLVSDPYYFETEVGRQFLKDLLKTAIHSNSYLMDEKVISGRMNDKEFDEVDQAVNKEANRAVSMKPFHETKRRHVKGHERKQKVKVNGIKSKKKKWGVYSLISLLVLAIIIFGHSIYEMIDYDIKSYQSAKKIEELISCILEPVDPYVSEENRRDDLIASGLYEDMNSNGESMNTDYEELVVLHQYSALYDRNQDMAGWITISDTIINYPVMLTKEDEEYYLKRDFDQNEDICGLPFMDEQCDIENVNNNYLIYGHNMKNGSMFSSLLEYEDYDFYHEHSVIQFDTIYEEGTYDIISIFQTQVAYQDEDVFRYYDLVDERNEEEYNNYVQKVQDMSIYDTGVATNFGDQLLVLSTCDRRIDNGRFVIVARKRT